VPSSEQSQSLDVCFSSLLCRLFLALTNDGARCSLLVPEIERADQLNSFGRQGMDALPQWRDGSRVEGLGPATIRVLGATGHPMRSRTCSKRILIPARSRGVGRPRYIESPVDYEGPSLEESRPTYLTLTDGQVLKQLRVDEGDERSVHDSHASERTPPSFRCSAGPGWADWPRWRTFSSRPAAGYIISAR
ncbi:hypothetical protein GQ607_005065, partial [Colletotrichum asianum]